MKLMVFATANIFKDTGTTSEAIEDTTFSLDENAKKISCKKKSY